MTTRFVASTTAQFTADLADIANGADAATNTAYAISAAAPLSVPGGTVTLRAGSTLELDGPGFIVGDDGTALTVAAPVTFDLPYTGDVVLSAGTLTVDPLATSNGIQAGGVFSGSITGDTAADAVLNGGSITNDGDTAIHLTGGTVNNRGGAVISGAADGVVFDGAATVTNGGAIQGVAVAVSLTGSAAVVNSAGAQISGGSEAIVAYASATIANAGTLAAATGDAVYLGSGLVSNTGQGAVISTGGFDAVEIASGGTVINDGAISSTDQAGVFLDAGGQVNNGSALPTASIRGAAAGVQIDGGGQVLNKGTISATGAHSAGSTVVGVLLSGGGSLTNGDPAATGTTTALAAGADWGVLAVGGSTAVTNNGTVSGATAVELDAGGTIVNGAGAVAGGLLSGAAFGARVVGSGTTASVVDRGTVVGGIAIDFFDATRGGATGTVVAGGVISSTSGAAGTAIRFGSGAETLVLSSGYAITGVVQGGLGANDQTTIELGSAVAAGFSALGGGSGLVSGGFGFIDITGVRVDAGGRATFSSAENTATLQVGGSAAVAGALLVATLNDDTGTLSVASGAMLELRTAAGHGNTIAVSSGGTLRLDVAAGFGTGQGTAAYSGDTISGFLPGAAIDLGDVAFATAAIQSYSAATGVLQVGDGSHVADLTFAATPFLPGMVVLGYDGSGGTLVETVACYCAGTLIATPGGEVAIETLAAGDLVLTGDGVPAPVRWVGRRSYAGRFLARAPQLWPIRIAAGALDGVVPRRDLLVSPQHAMLLDGLLVPAALLVNGTSITRARDMAHVAYFHLELDRHGVVLAEGAPSETFVDDGNRQSFQNAHEHSGGAAEPHPPAVYCAPRVEEGAALEAIRRRINRRAGTAAAAYAAGGAAAG